MPHEDYPSSEDATQPPLDLGQFLVGVNPDNYGIYRLDDEKSTQLITEFDRVGFLDARLPLEDISLRAIEAQRKIADGEALDYLRSLAFVTDNNLGQLKGNIRPRQILLKRSMFLKPDVLIGAANFNSWAGRGYMGSAQKDKKDGTISTSLEAIYDYATRETPLPKAEHGVDIISQPDGSTAVYSHNAHRAAAARLRGEPIEVDKLYLFE